MSTKADPAAFMTGTTALKTQRRTTKTCLNSSESVFLYGFLYIYFFFTYIYIYIFLMKWKWSGVIFPNVGFLVPFKVDTMSRLIHIAWAWSVSAVFFCRLIVQLDSKDLLRPWLCQLWMTRLAIFSSFFSPRGTWIGISPWSVCLMLIPPHSLCLCSRRAPSRLKLWEEGYSKRVTG